MAVRAPGPGSRSPTVKAEAPGLLGEGVETWEEEERRKENWMEHTKTNWMFGVDGWLGPDARTVTSFFYFQSPMDQQEGLVNGTAVLPTYERPYS